jgi:sensor histidine kinase regulating citrate/malate metabolism
MYDLGSFAGALACFVVELIFFGTIVTLFVMGHSRRAWTGPAPQNHSNVSAKQVTG